MKRKPTKTHWLDRLKQDKPRLKVLIITAVLANWLSEPLISRPFGITGIHVLTVWALTWSNAFYAWKMLIGWVDHFKSRPKSKST